MKKDRGPRSYSSKRRRKPPTRATEEAILSKCRRRCALCYAYDDNDKADLQGQLAHISHDRSDSSEENLAYLCLRHHDTYDSKRSQSKGITEGELRQAKGRLEEYMCFRGKHGLVQSRIEFEQSSVSFADTDCAKLIKQMEAIVEVSGTIIVGGLTPGGTSLQVEMQSDDIASLLRSFHRGDLASLRVASVKVSIIDRDRTVGYCPGVGVDRTLSFSEEIAIRLFREAEYFQDVVLKNHPGTLRIAASQNPFCRDLVTLSCGYAGPSRIDLIEPIILDRRKLRIDDLGQPFELLRKFLDNYGLTLQSPGGSTRSTLIFDSKFSQFSTLPLQLAAAAMIARILPLKERDNAGISSIHVTGPFSICFVILFAVNAKEREYQVRTWKESHWF